MDGSGGRLRVALAALAVTQIVGWGTTFYLPAVLGRSIAADTGLSETLVFGGVTLMLFASALVAPTAGRLLGRYGAAPFMTAGSLILAAGLLVLSVTTGPVLFVTAWLMLGAATPFALGQAASTAMVQVAPGRSRQAITVLLLFSGISSTASWPVLIWLDGAIGWRASLQVYVAIHALVCAPLHALALPRLGRRAQPDPASTLAAIAAPDEGAPAVPIRGAFWLAATAFSLNGFITWGLPLQIILMLREVGHSPGSAVAMGALLGPGQVFARALELSGGHRIGILNVGILGTAFMPVALLALAFGGASEAAAIVFVLGYGLSGGLTSIVRAVGPLRLFGRGAYATVLGQLALFQNIAFATAPVTFAAVREHGGARAVIAMSLAASLVALTASIVLARRAAASERVVSRAR